MNDDAKLEKRMATEDTAFEAWWSEKIPIKGHCKLIARRAWFAAIFGMAPHLYGQARKEKWAINVAENVDIGKL